jgi:hypothetical protein
MNTPCCSAAGRTPTLGCQDCGASCCAACVIHLESVTYCTACARTLLGTNAVRAPEPFGLF